MGSYKDTRIDRPVAELETTYNRKFTSTGVHRRLPDGPPEVDPQVDTSGIRRRKANLQRRPRKTP